MFLCLRYRKWFQLVLVCPRLRPTWRFGGFMVWMMTGGFWFLNETGRTTWDVKGKAVLGIVELHGLDVGLGNVLSVRVEVVWFVLGAGVGIVSGVEFEVVVGFVVDVLIGAVIRVDSPCKVFFSPDVSPLPSFFLNLGYSYCYFCCWCRCRFCCCYFCCCFCCSYCCCCCCCCCWWWWWWWWWCSFGGLLRAGSDDMAQLFASSA